MAAVCGNGLALSVTFGDSSPKGGALGKTGNFAVLPRPLPLGEVASRSDDGEGEAAAAKEAVHETYHCQ